jgi:hypothetical protein
LLDEEGEELVVFFDDCRDGRMPDCAIDRAHAGLVAVAGRRLRPLGGARARKRASRDCARVALQAPGSTSLGSGWGWHASRQSLTHHQLYSKTIKIGGGTSIPAGTTQLKIAVTFAATDFTAADDIDISVVDTCPPGGGTLTVASDASYDVRR